VVCFVSCQASAALSALVCELVYFAPSEGFKYSGQHALIGFSVVEFAFAVLYGIV
jgi:hypothetical protein